MNKIVLITTKGCQGCHIMHYNIEKALKTLDLKLNIRAEEIDLDQYIEIINLL